MMSAITTNTTYSAPCNQCVPLASQVGSLQLRVEALERLVADLSGHANECNRSCSNSHNSIAGPEPVPVPAEASVATSQMEEIELIKPASPESASDSILTAPGETTPLAPNRESTSSCRPLNTAESVHDSPSLSEGHTSKSTSIIGRRTSTAHTPKLSRPRRYLPGVYSPRFSTTRSYPAVSEKQGTSSPQRIKVHRIIAHTLRSDSATSSDARSTVAHTRPAIPLSPEEPTTQQNSNSPAGPGVASYSDDSLTESEHGTPLPPWWIRQGLPTPPRRSAISGTEPAIAPRLWPNALSQSLDSRTESEPGTSPPNEQLRITAQRDSSPTPSECVTPGLPAQLSKIDTHPRILSYPDDLPRQSEHGASAPRYKLPMPSVRSPHRNLGAQGRSRPAVSRLQPRRPPQLSVPLSQSEYNSPRSHNRPIQQQAGSPTPGAPNRFTLVSESEEESTSQGPLPALVFTAEAWESDN